MLCFGYNLGAEARRRSGRQGKIADALFFLPLANPSAMQHKIRRLGSQTGSWRFLGSEVNRNSNLIANSFTAALDDARLTVLTIVLIGTRKGAAPV
jgi:hypothetical protein